MSENWQPGPPGDPHGTPSGGQPGPYGDPHGAPSGGHPSPYGDPYPQPTGGYGAPAGYGAQPGGYGEPAPAYGYAVEPYREAAPNQTSAILALVVSILLVVTCCGALGVVGLVFSALSMTEKTDPDKARRHLRYAWIANGVVLGILAVCACLIGFAIATSEA